jgi:hypothetical protein
MTTKEKIIREAIDTVRGKIKDCEELFYANPLGRIFEIRFEAQKILKQHGNDHATIARLLKPLAEEEGLMLDVAEKQKNTNVLIMQLIALRTELLGLKNELFYISGKTVKIRLDERVIT